MKQVTLTTDGACIGNPGPGGWAYILGYGQHVVERGGREPAKTTNNRMELQAAIEGLKALKEPCEVLLVTDSTYLSKGIEVWRHGWRKSGWIIRRNNSQPVVNADLWKVLDELVEKHVVTCMWVRGHTGHPDNERCDKLATLHASGQLIS
jgi:ribonuclease HI